MTKSKIYNKTNPQLNYIEKINYPDRKPEYVVIWLHGLGADCHDFVPIVPELKLNTCVKFIFPDAPIRPITINGGVKMRAWYDIRDLTRLDNTIDYNGINQSVEQVEELIKLQIQNGFEPQQIFIAGFSQGGVIAYSLVLKTAHKLRGAVIISAYLPNLSFLGVNIGEGFNHSIPILACHGKQDMVVPYELGMSAYETLHNLKYNIVWRNYSIEHTVSIEEVRDIGLWVNDKT